MKRCFSMTLAFLIIIIPAELHETLSNGVQVPMIGFGTAGRLNSEPMSEALRQGYKLLDSAQAREWYDERACGKAVRESSRKREEIFIITKLHPRDHGTRSARRKIEESLKNLDTDYIDGFLLHFPRCWGDMCPRKPEGTWKDSWRVLEDYNRKGVIKAIGVSNFRIQDLEELLKFAEIEPHFVQNWHDPFHQDRQLVQLCQDNDILFQAYSSLGNQWGHRGVSNPVFGNPVLKQIAKETGKSVAQVVLKWQLAEGIAVIPRSSKPERIRENKELDFELSSDQIDRIRNLDGTAESDDQPQSISMTIKNSSDRRIDVKWEERDNGNVESGNEIRINTYDTHRWSFFVEGRKLREFRILLKDGLRQEFVFTNNDISKLEL